MLHSPTALFQIWTQKVCKHNVSFGALGLYSWKSCRHQAPQAENLCCFEVEMQYCRAWRLCFQGRKKQTNSPSPGFAGYQQEWTVWLLSPGGFLATADACGKHHLGWFIEFLLIALPVQAVNDYFTSIIKIMYTHCLHSKASLWTHPT